ncbi:hypothetical protein INT43_003183 [Umbelopsis isabellina]|uniref:Uncharacterized protein n=1 Tax=Mortierella isabellina TaxID=91625 RepID=A0A8H7UA32_MORIS|nr:hypothetical protein INT43_003183 [Umbelopsis isabellina]
MAREKIPTPTNYNADSVISGASAPSVDELIENAEQSKVPPPSYNSGVVHNEQPVYDFAGYDSHVSTLTAAEPSIVEYHANEEDNSVYAPLLGNAVGDVNMEEYVDLTQPPEYAPYRATYKMKKKGVVSRDHHINEDGEALFRFLLDHNSPPAMSIKVRGYHDETRWRTETHRNSDGTTREEQHSYTEQVTDFDFAVDVSQYVSPTCAAMYVEPDKKTGKTKTVRQLCDDYVKEKGQFKELEMRKSIDWNYKELTQAILYAIRHQGYHHTVDITFPLQNNRVTVKCNSKLSELYDSWWFKAILVVTCLWLIAIPTFYVMRKKFGHKNLKSEWQMKISEEQWYQQHVYEVLAQVQCRSI